MCDQDHFEQDREEFAAQGLVTRRQFGVMLGAGMAMMLPQVKNPVAVIESDVTVTTPDGTADCYFVHPAAGRADVAAQQVEERGLAGAVRADDRVQRARLDRERDTRHRQQTAEVLLEIDCFQKSGHSSTPDKVTR